jgi:trk system potassium uptake protein TrkH
MFCAGINFSLHYQLLFKKNFKVFLKNTEVKFYIFISLVSTLILTVSLIINNNYDTISNAFRYAVFQAVSIVTTTGYGTADFEKWSYLCQFLLVILMLVGGCAGSTGGGIKHIRIFVYLKYTFNQIFKIIHPSSVKHLKLEGKILDVSIVSSIISFIALYFLVFTCSSILLLAFGGQDIVTSLSAVIATLSNIGPGLGNVGPVDNFSGFTDTGKYILSFCMIVGRLEFYTVLVMLHPDFWKNIKL